MSTVSQSFELKPRPDQTEVVWHRGGLLEFLTDLKQAREMGQTQNRLVLDVPALEHVGFKPNNWPVLEKTLKNLGIESIAWKDSALAKTLQAQFGVQVEAGTLPLRQVPSTSAALRREENLPLSVKGPDWCLTPLEGQEWIEHKKEMDLEPMMDRSNVYPLDQASSPTLETDWIWTHGVFPVGLRARSSSHKNPSCEWGGFLKSEGVGLESGLLPAQVYRARVRSGETIQALHRDLLITDRVSQGAEVSADGSVQVLGPCRGRVIAGRSGRVDVHIICQEFFGELVAIGGLYQVFEDMPEEMHGKSVMFWREGEKICYKILKS